MALVAASSARAAGVPSSLQRVESAAEDLVDVALAHQRAEAARSARELPDLARAAAPALRRADVPAAQVRELERLAARVAAAGPRAGFLQVALDANQISGLVPQLYSHFRTAVPPRVYALDYLDREAQLRSLAGQRSGARAAVDKLAPSWQRLRPRVVAAGGAREARLYDGHVRALQRLAHAGSLPALAHEAARGLELVDELERVFA